MIAAVTFFILAVFLLIVWKVIGFALEALVVLLVVAVLLAALFHFANRRR